MSIILKGYALNQRQLDAIVPVMNDMMHGKVSQKKFEQACVEALEKAGCALGYDTTMPGADKSIEERANKWIVDGRVGQSSKAIWSHMMGVAGAGDRFGVRYPLDPDDLNRCLLLLDLIPEWAPRMAEMAKYNTQWAGLAKNWGEIAECFLNEVGLNWCKAKSAPKTYAMMKRAMGEA